MCSGNTRNANIGPVLKRPLERRKPASGGPAAARYRDLKKEIFLIRPLTISILDINKRTCCVKWDFTRFKMLVLIMWQQVPTFSLSVLRRCLSPGQPRIKVYLPEGHIKEIDGFNLENNS